MRRTINLAEITEEGLLLVNKKGIWILPGGKPLNERETHYETLIRELKEELSVSEEQIKIYNFYNSFIRKTPSKGKLLENRVYFGAINGSLKPSAEINEAKRIKDFENYRISERTSKIIFSLKQGRYL